jgi:hypothetical protein
MAEMLPANPNGITTIGNSTHIWLGASDSQSIHYYNAGINLTQAFHTYELDWTPSQLIFKFDGTTTTTLAIAAGTFDQPMFLLFDQETDATAGTAAAWPITTQMRSIQVWDQSNNLIFADLFPGIQGGFWSGIP